MIYQSLCAHFGLPVTQSLAPLLPCPEITTLEVTDGQGIEAAMQAACTSVYPLLEDDARTREALQSQQDDVSDAFDLLRKTYPVRREFSTLTIHGISQQQDRQLMSGLGFQVI